MPAFSSPVDGAVDTPKTPGAFVHSSAVISLHRELELLSQAGLEPSDILAAATARTAEAFNLADRGKIQPGMRADMLLVGGDPTSDMATRDILRIWKGGLELARE